MIEEDYFRFVSSFPLAEHFRGCRFVITGATGLIGRTLVNCLISLDNRYDLDLSICCPVRNRQKAQELLPNKVEIIDYNINNSLFNEADYIVHGACPTSSTFFVEHPVETFNTIIGQTQQILNVIHEKKEVKGVVYLSSLESYGTILNDEPVKEDCQGYIDPMSARSCYSLGKRAAENLCHCYAKEFDVPVRIARLTQTFGSHVADTDNRVFAQFARSIVQGKDIVMHTRGHSSKPYIFDIDAANAILFLLVKGESGLAYNVANEDSYMSIREMAEYLCLEFNPDCRIINRFINQNIYSPETHLNLDTAKLQSLGWYPLFKKQEMFAKLIQGIRNHH